MRLPLFFGSFGLLLSLATFGCGDDDGPSQGEPPDSSSSSSGETGSSSGGSSSGETGSSSGGSSSGGDADDKPLNEVDADEITAACQRDGGAWSGPTEAERFGACLSNAAQVSIEECIDETAACEESDSYSMSFSTCEEFAEQFSSQLAGCDAPLSLLTTCRRDQSEAYEAFFAPFATVTNCDEVKPHDVPRDLPASCVELLTRCPDLAN